MLILSASDVSSVVASFSFQELVELMARVFYRVHHHKGIVSPHRLSIESANYNALFMPSRIDEYFTAIKIVSVPTNNKASSGLPASTVVLDEETGSVRALMNAGSLTALRNASGSVLATRLLGPSNPVVLLAFGAGKQIEAHVRLMLQTYKSLTRCILINRSRNSRLTNLEQIFRREFPKIVFECLDSSTLDETNLGKLVSSADVICTATSSRTPLFRADWVKDGTHLNLIGSYTKEMVEVEEALIRRAVKVVVDSREACLIEAGDLINANLSSDQMVEIGQLVNEDCTPNIEEIAKIKKTGNVTLFKSVGLGVQDVAIAGAVLKKALSIGVGTKIENY